MVSLVAGHPGSGKSYYAVKQIYDTLAKPDKHDIDVIYTNIAGIKIDGFPDSNIEFKKLREDDLYNYLTECFKLYEKYKDEDDVDEHLIEYSKKRGFHKAFIIFDECQYFLSNQDKIKIFWLTYHRHLYHEILLLTQNKSLINSKYRSIPEQFVEAQPRSKKILSSTLTYKYYASFAMRKADLYKNSSIKTTKEVFSLYKSGNKSYQKSIILKFMAILGFGFIVASFLFFNLLNTYETEEIKEPVKEESKNTTRQTSTRAENKRSDESIEEHYFNILVNYESDNGYLVKDRYYHKEYFKRFIKRTKSKILYKDLIYETNTYRMEKMIIRTSNTDLNKYFYVEEDELIKEQLKEKNRIRKKEL